MIITAWIASGLGLVYLRQFFHEVRWRQRAWWGTAVLGCAAVVAYAVSGMPAPEVQKLLFKIVTVGSLAAVVWFVWRYSIMDKWWTHALGWTLISKDLLLALLFVMTILALFGVNLSPWLSIGMLAGIPPILIWRTEVWQRIHDTAGDTMPGSAQDGSSKR